MLKAQDHLVLCIELYIEWILDSKHMELFSSYLSQFVFEGTRPWRDVSHMK